MLLIFAVIGVALGLPREIVGSLLIVFLLQDLA